MPVIIYKFLKFKWFLIPSTEDVENLLANLLVAEKAGRCIASPPSCSFFSHQQNPYFSMCYVIVQNLACKYHMMFNVR